MPTSGARSTSTPCFDPDSDALSNLERHEARWHPERVVGIGRGRRRQGAGARSRATKALALAATTMANADLWQARLAVKTLRRDQREAIAEAGED